MLKRLVAAIIVAAMVGSVAFAYTLDDGDEAYMRNDFATAVQLWTALADKGDAYAAYKVGMLYGTGVGKPQVPQDYAEAAKWYRRAGEQGNAQGQFYLGVLYDRGQGVPQDYVEAVKWYRLAAV